MWYSSLVHLMQMTSPVGHLVMTTLNQLLSINPARSTVSGSNGGGGLLPITPC